MADSRFISRIPACWFPDLTVQKEIDGTIYSVLVNYDESETPDEIEAGHVSMVIVKDLTRFGLNSALTGMYTNITFAKYGVRFIAVNDNYDTINPNSVDNDFAGIKIWFNEFYARVIPAGKSVLSTRLRGSEGNHWR